MNKPLLVYVIGHEEMADPLGIEIVPVDEKDVVLVTHHASFPIFLSPDKKVVIAEYSRATEEFGKKLTSPLAEDAVFLCGTQGVECLPLIFDSNRSPDQDKFLEVLRTVYFDDNERRVRIDSLISFRQDLQVSSC